ncbi:MAG: DUF2065 family protein [Elusimicrobiota bacterium]
MILIAKIVCVFIMIEGLMMSVFPLYTKKVTEDYNQLPSGQKRSAGLFMILAGLILVYAGRAGLASPLAHWIITVSGIFMGLYGTFTIIIPGTVSRLTMWFYAEKGPITLIGAIMAAGGLVLYIMV